MIAEVVSEILPVVRVRNGIPVPTDLGVICFDGRLTVSSDWSERKGEWTQRRVYDVTLLETKWEGRAFSLVKRDADESHEVFISDDGAHLDICSCRGYTAFAY